MTKKDYELIAEAIELELEAVQRQLDLDNVYFKEARMMFTAIKNVGYRLNGLLANQDPKFNGWKFKSTWESKMLKEQ